MKKKLIAVVMLITMILPMFLNLYKVEAYSGELDPESYISLPYRIWVEDGTGTGTISLSSSASGYSISYQKVDITEEKFNLINNKNNERNSYVEETNTIVREKSANVQALNTEWQNLEGSETATEEQIQEAKTKYEEAYYDYNEYCDTVKANIEKLENDYMALIPDYTNSWTKTTNTEKNVQLDFKDYSGRVDFVLWAKITNGTNTYYDMNVYSSTVEVKENVTISKTIADLKVDETLQLTATSSTNADITWTSSDKTVATVNSEGLVTGVKEGTAVITAKGSEKTATCTVTVGAKDTTGEGETTGDWTDFSNAKFELKKDGTSEAVIEISGVTPKEEREYYLFITSDNSQPNVTSEDEEKIYLKYDSENKMLTTAYNSVTGYVELNQDLYVTILEKQSYKSEQIVIYGKKLERYEEPKYSDAFFATYMSYESTQIITNFTHGIEHNRDFQIKIGKITDKSILQKIKNQDSSGFAELLRFAKENSGIYNEKASTLENSYMIDYDTDNEGREVINLKNLQDDEYYFLYVEAYDENGKYISQEAVTLAQASVHKNGDWYLFFYGDEDFEWADFGNEGEEDNTKAPEKLPDTGIGKYITIISILAIVVIASYIQIRKMKEIR